ncbi:MAG: polysaccharide deacetylase family protein [Oscillospiraceae bacterium]|nr:polysaccharide deacetylase family protein [Oscillospiraceae bacterium]
MKQTKARKTDRLKQKKAVRKKKGLVIALMTLIYLVIVAAAAVIIDDRHIEITVFGDEDMLAEAGESFADPGAEAFLTGNLFGRAKKPVEMHVESGVDTARIGDYTIKYSAEAFGRSAESYRRVRVRDTTPPVITLNREEGYLASWLVGYTEEGYTALDSFDGDLTDKVIRTETGDAVYYSVADSAGNETKVERVIEYGISEPMIRLTGGETIDVGADFTFTDPGYEATDESGNDLTSYVQVTGKVVPNKLGSYVLNYTIMNERGETASASRTVNVVAQPVPETIMPEQKTIYLTFDDGPSAYTDSLLDTLARYGAKATFFVTNLDPDYVDCIGRAFREGHAIGVHTLTHDYYTVYSSDQAFYDDFLAMEEIIYRQTGSYTRLFRFPGGSSNTVSRNYNYGIMTRLAQSMTEMGYVYFDWNVDSGDALGGAKSSYEVANNVATGCLEHTANVVLQHDTKAFSVQAVENILRWGRNNGYVFEALNENCFTAHHDIAN